MNSQYLKFSEKSEKTDLSDLAEKLIWVAFQYHKKKVHQVSGFCSSKISKPTKKWGFNLRKKEGKYQK